MDIIVVPPNKGSYDAMILTLMIVGDYSEINNKTISQEIATQYTICGLKGGTTYNITVFTIYKGKMSSINEFCITSTGKYPVLLLRVFGTLCLKIFPYF